MNIVSRVRLFLIVVTLFSGLRAAAATEWQLVADRGERMPLDHVVCLMAGDASDRLTVVGIERNISDVGRVSFEAVEKSSLPSIGVETDGETSLVYADNVITVYGLLRDADLTIHTADGRLVRSTFVRAGSGPVTVDLSGLEPGIYVGVILDSSVKILKK